jgi:hypothetical protein
MTSISKNVALLMGLAVIASVGATYALTQTVQSPQVHVERTGMLGHLQLVLYGPDGNIKTYRQTDNLVVLNGDNATADKLFVTGANQGRKLTSCTACKDTNVGTFQYIGVGISATTPTVTDQQLASQVSSKKIATSVTNGTASNTGHGTIQIQTTFAANKLTNSTTASIQEAGLFDQPYNFTGSGSGPMNMFSRQTFSSIGVNPADTLQITWTIAIT